MTAVFGAPGPRIFGAPPGADFAGSVAVGLRQRLSGAPADALARVELVVNTQRTRRALSEAFESGAAEGATYLPRISTLDGFADGVVDAPPPEDRLARRLTLTRLVEARLASDPRLGPPGAAGPLAASLATLLDEMQREGVPFSALAQAADGEHAAHWGETLRFLEVIGDVWPAHLAAAPARSDPEARRAADVKALVGAWADQPPDRVVIAAGSTGSQKVTADLLIAIAGLPQGAVVLPGFDFHMDDAGWAAAGPDHPQFGFKALLERLGLEPGDVARWSDAPDSPRARLLAEALRPAPATHHWRRALPKLSETIGAATGGVTLIEAPSPRREAEAIAVLMRRALEEDGAVAALVSPDRGLARRVAAILARWGLEPDDSAGRPLALTPPGVFLTLLAATLAKPFDPVMLLAALKHPLAAEGEGRGAHFEAVARLEARVLRRRDVALGLRTIADLKEAWIAVEVERAVRAGEEGAPASAVSPVAGGALAGVLDALAPWPTTPRPLDALIGDLLAAGRAVAGPGLWDKKAGRHAEAALARFARAAGGYGAVAPAAFPALLSAALEEAGDVREEAFRAHPQLKIWGPLEARAQCADLMILGGLNEGVWPRGAAIDPWLSRPMRARIGLPQPERRTGLSAHDFQQAASAPRVAMTRALKADGAPTTASRWLARLTTLLNGIGRGDDRGAALVAMRARGAEVLALAEAAADAPFGDLRPAPTPALRPAPRPPVAARPRRLYATDVEALIRDPYAVYAKRVLRLRRLDEPGLGADARLRGEALHAVAERFISATKDEWPAAGDAAALFDRLADETLAEIGAPAAATLAWSARLARIRDWFVASEAKRRAGAAPVGVELDGLTTIAAPAGLFEIRGRADRIDLLASGELAIYDYKAGGAPSERQVAVFAKQLPVLSVIAERGGFADAPAAPVRRTAYLSLSGAGAGGAERTIPPDEDAFAGLSALIASFDVEAQAYPPRAFPEAMSYASDYDHLSRYGEWSDREPET